MDNLFTEMHIKVSPTELIKKTDALQASIAKLELYYNNVDFLINKTSNYWIGEAGDLYRQQFNIKKDKSELMLKKLKEYPTDLISIAQNYNDVENSIKNEINILSGNVIK